ncbi:DNA fragmentation factor subunit beta [Venturia canescens]|uniref:DNA fragmentation factor subunit beta n=1 Tax=Venturia canescens TaxID=32260 RepID=UPI001C9C29BC|nr:DNA fragmentation factor subunit beta [Venturia canescens]XP_043277797.1 DNA fragmentation factor subunit beta [Venturia canescens]XP_043277801.1 DNA fragmentation factor subunit beta [Venturia canescens]
MSSLLANCFRKLTEAPTKHELRGFKVTDINRTRKFGVACRSLQELKRKACTKLNVTNDLAEINIFLLDGALIDEDYFHTLEPQTTLVLQRPGEQMLSDADLLYETLRRVNIDFLTVGDKAAKFLTENLKRKVAVIHGVLNRDDTKTLYNNRDEHPEWFRGLETNVTTKEAYLHRRCQDRIRNYLYKTIEQIKESETWTNNRQARLRLHHVIEYFKMQLRKDHYFGYYFDRSCSSQANCEDEVDRIGNRENDCYEHCPCKLGYYEDDEETETEAVNEPTFEDTTATVEDETDARRITRLSDSGESTGRKPTANRTEKATCPFKLVTRSKEEQVSLCDANGEFRCEGMWNLERCSYGERHQINPYRSHEELVIFSTWNLDHKIERSRTLVPQLLKVSEQEIINDEDVISLYDNLFTVKNLRLVHIVCHDKGTHK